VCGEFTQGSRVSKGLFLKRASHSQRENEGRSLSRASAHRNNVWGIGGKIFKYSGGAEREGRTNVLRCVEKPLGHLMR